MSTPLGKAVQNNLSRPKFSDVLKEVPGAAKKVGRGAFDFFSKNSQALVNTAVENMGSAAAYHLVPEVREAVDSGKYVLPPMRESQTAGLKKIGGQMIGSVAELAPWAKGASIANAASKVNPNYLKLALGGAKSGLGYGASYGLGNALQSNAGLKDAVLQTLQGSGTGLVAGAALAPALGFIGAHAQDKLHFPNLDNSSNQRGFVAIPGLGEQGGAWAGGVGLPKGKPSFESAMRDKELRKLPISQQMKVKKMADLKSGKVTPDEFSNQSIEDLAVQSSKEYGSTPKDQKAFTEAFKRSLRKSSESNSLALDTRGMKVMPIDQAIKKYNATGSVTVATRPDGVRLIVKDEGKFVKVGIDPGQGKLVSTDVQLPQKVFSTKQEAFNFVKLLTDKGDEFISALKNPGGGSLTALDPNNPTPLPPLPKFKPGSAAAKKAKALLDAMLRNENI